jgi:protein required for attachment to host cells
MKTTWVVLADGGAARFFDASRSVGSMVEVTSMVHPEGRLPARALTSDLPGRAFDSAGQGRHAMESEVGPREQAAREFAGLIAARLDEARRKGEVQRIVVAAAPAFLGLLRKAMTAETRQIVAHEFDRDWVKLPLEELRRRLGDAMQTAEG